MAPFKLLTHFAHPILLILNLHAADFAESFDPTPRILGQKQPNFLEIEELDSLRSLDLSGYFLARILHYAKLMINRY